MEVNVMKSKEELNTLKEEVEALNKKLHELSEEELQIVNGGSVEQILQLSEGNKNIIETINWLQYIEAVNSSDEKMNEELNALKNKTKDLAELINDEITVL